MENREQFLDELILLIQFLKNNPDVDIPHNFKSYMDKADYTTTISKSKTEREQFDHALIILGTESISCWATMITLRKRFGDFVSIAQTFTKDELYVLKRRHDPELDSLLENICTKANEPKERSA